MATSWNLTRNKICEKALQKVGALARGETADPDDMEIVVDALDGLLKGLPIYGYAWPRTAPGQTALPLVAATQNTNLPADYYGGAIISFLDAAGNEKELSLVPLIEWNRLVRKTETAQYPLLGYLDQSNVLRTWPVQTATLAGKLVYQRIISDTVTGTETGLKATWMLGLIKGVAYEIGDEFGATEEQMARWLNAWEEVRSLNIMGDTFPTSDRMTVSD